MDELKAQLDRIETKLDMLIKALAEDDDQPTHTLDGDAIPAERGENEEL